MTRNRDESSLFEPVCRFLRGRGFSRQRGEVPFFEYRIDVYGLAVSTRETVAVELKLEKWRRAFEQAIIYQLCADRVYVGMPIEFAHRVDLGLFRAHGVGLIVVSASDRCREVLAPQTLDVVKSYYRESYIDILTRRAHGRSEHDPPTRLTR